MGKAMGYCIPCHDRGATVQAVAVVDGDGLCGVCLRAGGNAVPTPSAKPVPLAAPVVLCGRGCGKPSHRGLCAGGRKPAVPPLSPPVPAPVAASPLLTNAVDMGFRTVAAKIESFLARPVVLPPVEIVAVNPNPPSPTAEQRKERMDKLVSKRVRVEDIPSEATERTPVGRIGELWLKVLALLPGEAECVENMDVPHAGYTYRHMMGKARKAGVNLRARRVGLQLYFWVEPASATKSEAARG